MSSVMDTVQENFSKLPKWGWIAIIGGFALVAFLSSKRTTYTPAPSYAEGGMESNKVAESEVANRINQVVRDLEGQFEIRFKDQASEFNQSLTDKDLAAKEQLDAYNEGWSDRVNALTSSFNERIQSLMNQSTPVNYGSPASTYEPPRTNYDGQVTYAPKQSYTYMSHPASPGKLTTVNTSAVADYIKRGYSDVGGYDNG